MSIYEYEIGGNEVVDEGSEGIVNIPQNRTLMVEQLTKETPPNPELVMGLETIEDVFEHFRPQLDVAFKNEEGQVVKETFKFENVGDFSVKRMTEKSSLLSDLNINKEFYGKTAQQLGSNRVLMRSLSTQGKKANIIDVLQSLKLELEQSINAEN